MGTEPVLYDFTREYILRLPPSWLSVRSWSAFQSESAQERGLGSISPTCLRPAFTHAGPKRAKR